MHGASCVQMALCHSITWESAEPMSPGVSPCLLAPLAIKDIGRQSRSLDLPNGQRVDP